MQSFIQNHLNFFSVALDEGVKAEEDYFFVRGIFVHKKEEFGIEFEYCGETTSLFLDSTDFGHIFSQKGDLYMVGAPEQHSDLYGIYKVKELSLQEALYEIAEDTVRHCIATRY